MPQLMPLYWKMYFFMVIFLVLGMMMLYGFSSVEMGLVKSSEGMKCGENEWEW